MWTLLPPITLILLQIFGGSKYFKDLNEFLQTFVRNKCLPINDGPLSKMKQNCSVPKNYHEIKLLFGDVILSTIGRRWAVLQCSTQRSEKGCKQCFTINTSTSTVCNGTHKRLVFFFNRGENQKRFNENGWDIIRIITLEFDWFRTTHNSKAIYSFLSYVIEEYNPQFEIQCVTADSKSDITCRIGRLHQLVTKPIRNHIERLSLFVIMLAVQRKEGIVLMNEDLVKVRCWNTFRSLSNSLLIYFSTHQQVYKCTKSTKRHGYAGFRAIWIQQHNWSGLERGEDDVCVCVFFRLLQSLPNDRLAPFLLQ